MTSFYKIPLTADLSNTSYRESYANIDDSTIYIEYNEGYVGNDWTEISEVEYLENLPKPIPTPEPLSETEQAIIDTAVNIEYLIALQELGLLVTG